MGQFFWQKFSEPIIGLSPMDGVTDPVFRFLTAREGRPDVVFTEFTTAEGLFHAPERILRDFEYSEIERPIVAQLYGHHPEDFYRATLVVCELGFDGIDINMGCPARQVTQKNCGAKLITLPDLAMEILRATRQATTDWANGETLEKGGIPEPVIAVVSRMNRARVGMERPAERSLLPCSVKTRIGYDSVVIEQWVETLLREEPAVISIHGRTLKQMYKGRADWEAIAQAVTVARGSGTLILGNGDLTSREEALKTAERTGVDGVLIGRSSIGNPWIFQEGDRPVGREERIGCALEHAKLVSDRRGERAFAAVKKHLARYLRHFSDAGLLRKRAMEAKNCLELEKVLHIK